MNRGFAWLLVLGVTTGAVAAQTPATYRAPRTADGHPDLQGVWNFNTGVPLQRPDAFKDKPFFTKEEFDKQQAAVRNGIAAIAKFAPVEAVGLDWTDGAPLVDDLRTSLITYPENGRLPALVTGVRRVPGPQDLIAALD